MPQLPRAHRAKRTDKEGRAFAGSQLHLQIWVNRRSQELSRYLLDALRIVAPPDAVRWLSPLEGARFREYRDGAFLRAIGLEHERSRLRDFWPAGGPVWDGLAVVDAPNSKAPSIVLLEAKSYPEEVHGGGCKATPGSDALRTIRSSLARTAHWLGIARTPAWEGRLYQSANRIAHLYFLREILNLDAYMLNVCFVGDRRRPTTPEQWHKAGNAFREELGLSAHALPWLADVTLPAGERSELLASP